VSKVWNKNIATMINRFEVTVVVFFM